jgi:hypothetical protein
MVLCHLEAVISLENNRDTKIRIRTRRNIFFQTVSKALPYGRRGCGRRCIYDPDHVYQKNTILTVPSIAGESGIRPPKKSSYGRWALDTVGLPLRYKKVLKIDKITEKRQFPMDFFCKTVDQL